LENRLKKKLEDKEKARTLRMIAETENEKTIRAQESERIESMKRLQGRLSARRPSTAQSYFKESKTTSTTPPSLFRVASKMLSKRSLVFKEDEASKGKPTLLDRMASGLRLSFANAHPTVDKHASKQNEANTAQA
jgi:hypothetical protein